jgi:hypothetical protein
MLRLQDIPPEQMPEVVRVASELYEKDKENEVEAAQRQATVEAAAEVGLPEEYLHRAAAELHTRRVVQIEQKRRKRNGMLAVGGALLVLGTAGYFVMNRTAAPPATTQVSVARTPISPAFSPTLWNLKTNQGTQATVKFKNDTATIHVDRFAKDTNDLYFANLNTFDGPKDLTGYHTISFRVQGTLPNVRLFLENGTERWRSALVKVEGPERLAKVDLDQFEYLTRSDTNSRWHNQSYRPPGTVSYLSFKTGDNVNVENASGDVTLSDIHIE